MEREFETQPLPLFSLRALLRLQRVLDERERGRTQCGNQIVGGVRVAQNDSVDGISQMQTDADWDFHGSSRHRT